MGEIERHTNEYCPVCGKWHEIITAGCAPDWPFCQQSVEKTVNIPVGEEYLKKQYQSFYKAGRSDALKEAVGKIV